MSKSVEMKLDTCSNCGYGMDAATGVGDASGARPEPGNLSLCLKCGHVTVFDVGLARREMTPEEKAEIDADPDVALYRDRIYRQQIALGIQSDLADDVQGIL